MKENPFKGPGDDDLKKMKGPNGKDPDPNPKPPEDHELTTGKGGGAAAKKTKEEREQAATDAQTAKENTPTDAMVKANTPPKEEDDKQAITVTISNCRWDRDKGTYKGTAIALMNIHIPPAQADKTRVMVGVEMLKPNGNWEADGQPKECHAKDGKAECELTFPEPAKNKDGTLPKEAYFRFTAKHSRSEEAKSPRLETVPGPENPFESVIYYSPTRKQYLMFENEEDYKTILVEIEKLDGLKGKTRKAMEATDHGERKKLLKEVDEETEKLFDGEHIGESEALEELLLVRRNPRWGKSPGWVYIRPHAKKNGTPIKGHWRSDRDATVQKNLEELLKKAPGSKEHSPFFEGELKLKLFRVDPLQKQWPLQWYDKKDTEGSVAGHSFTFSHEAAVTRFMLGWDGIEATVNLKEKKIHLGTSGYVSYGLFEGTTEAKFPWPEKGVNLLEFLKKKTYLDPLITKGRTCLLRLKFGLSAKAFAGLTVGGALNLLDLDLSKEKVEEKKKTEPEKKEVGPKVSAGVTGSGFAGIQGSLGLEVDTEWSQKEGAKFDSLGSCAVEAGGMAGAGAETDWKIEYRNGNFHFIGAAGLAVGLGCRGKFSFEMSVDEGWRFMGYLLNCIDYHYALEIEKEAFNVYANYTFSLMTEGEKALVKGMGMAGDMITNFHGWLDTVGNKLDNIKKSISEYATYSGTLTNVPPEALGQALLTIMKSRGTDDFRSILLILRSTLRRDANVLADPNANHKLKWTIRSVSYMGDPKAVKPETEPEREEALKKGIKKIEDFGLAIGYVDELGNPQEQNEIFLGEFHNLLKKYEVR